MSRRVRFEGNDWVVVSAGTVRKAPSKKANQGIEWQHTPFVKRYSIELDMLEFEDTFEVELPYTRKLFGFANPDNLIEITINGIKVMVGFIDKVTRRKSKSGGSTFVISGRSKAGRVIDESAPLGRFLGIGIKQLAERMVTPWYPKVTLSNTRNRRLFRAKALRSAQVSSEPGIVNTKDHDLKVNPGDSRGEVLGEFLREARLLAWGAPDGTEWIISRPNYNQEPQFQFRIPTSDDIVNDGWVNVLDFSYEEDVSNMYSKIVVCGESRGDGVNYSANVTRHAGVAYDNPSNTTDGTGRAFQFRKALLIQDSDVKSKGVATAKAKRAMYERQSQNLGYRLIVPGHSQARALYHFDAVAVVDDVETFGPQKFFVTRVAFSGDNSGQATELSLVPVGAALETGGMSG